MLFLLIAYLGGVLTILSPCILPVIPFVFARVDRPFSSHGLPMLAGMAIAFAGVATLAAISGGWVVVLNEAGRYIALTVFGVFGLALLVPAVSDHLTRPLVAVGARLSGYSAERTSLRSSAMWSLALGVGTGLLWAPCAGPILGLILTTAALHGASLGTSVLLLAYAAGAATSLAAALLFGGRLVSLMKRSLPAGEWVRRATGAAVLLGVSAIALGLDTKVLSRVTFSSTTAVEKALVDQVRQTPGSSAGLGSGGLPAAVQVLAQASPARSPALLPLRDAGPVPSFSGAVEWINSAPLTTAALRGKVVLVDFWTYSCINCLRTLPHLRAWSDKYKDAGLVIVGVHTPEFAFEKRSSNVRNAVTDLGIGFPVAIDNDFAIWRAFGNMYWPAFYFVDAKGRIRHHQFGEGGYENSEQVIRQLLAEAGRDTLSTELVSPRGEGVQAAPGAGAVLSGETYLGYERSSGPASLGPLAPDRVSQYNPPPRLRLNQWALTGGWVIERERAVLATPVGRVAYRFQARDLHLVLGRTADGKPVRFKVTLDGKPPLADHGSDTDSQGNGTIDAQRLYQLVRQQSNGPQRLFEIEFLEPGVQAYVFTFG